MSANDVHVFRDSVARIVRALTDSNISVRQEGLKAYVEYDANGRPKSVTLPSIPDNASADLLNAIQGFLDHEVSHVLHTDFEYSARQMKACEKAHDKISPALWNIVEDVYIERRMSERFRGSMVNIDNVQRYLTGKMIKEDLEKLLNSGADAKTIQSFLLPSAVRAAGGQPVFEEFMRGKWELMGPLAKGIQALGKTFQNAASTQDCWGATKELYNVVVPPKSKGGGGGDDKGGDGGEGKSKRPDSKKSEDGSSHDQDSGMSGDTNPEKGDVDDDSSDGAGDSGGSDEGESEGQSKSDSGEPGKPGEGESEGGGSGSNRDASDKNDQHGIGGSSRLLGDDQEEAEKDEVEAQIDPELVKPIEDAATKAIEQAVHDQLSSGHHEYVPFSRDMDYIGPLPEADGYQRRSLDDSQVAKTANETCHVIQSEVERLFRARSAVRWNPGQRKGHINRAALHRISTGDDRVFRTKMESQSRAVAVQLVIDCSGSMSWVDKIGNASIAAYMLASVLDRIGVPCEILGFTTLDRQPKGKSSDDWHRYMDAVSGASASGVTFARYAPTALYVFKDFAKRFDDVAKKTLGFLPSTRSMLNNVDGESIEQAALRMRLRKEPRKVMIVMSDGQPAADGSRELAYWKLKDVVQNVERSGIEIYGLGLADGAVKNYYANNEVIWNTEEIPGKVIALIQRLLIQ